MNYSVKSIAVFERQAKRLIKKFPSLKSELLALVEDLKLNPSKGTSLGKNCFKIRLSVRSKGEGKSGGARIITHFVVSEYSVFLLSIYDKVDKGNLTNKELVELLESLPD